MYSDRDLDSIARDRDRLRAYYWRMAQHHRRLAAEHRRTSRANLVSFEEGRDLLRWAGTLERVADIVLDNLDVITEASYEGDS
jgi:plasmid stability protein